MKQVHIWVEITTLVVPSLNDTEKKLADIAGFIASIDCDIPWHVSRFHPDYQLTDVPATPAAVLKKAYTLGKQAGLRYIYLGNVPGETAETACPNCNVALISRQGFWVAQNSLKNSRCPQCAAEIAGLYSKFR